MKVVIAGAGASGVSAAIKIKQLNADIDVTLLEHLDAILKKIHATGNGRCNITNTNAEHYNEVKDFLNSLGLMLREDDMGRMYPYSNQSASVVSILTDACEKAGVNIITDSNVKSAEYSNGRYTIYTDCGTFEADIFIIATGGKSQPSLGSDGSGYSIAKSFGHTISSLSPSLVQLKSTSKHCRALRGIRVKCNLKIETNNTIMGEEYGELLFTEYGISGIVTMNMSRYINDERLIHGKDKSIAVIDFVPDMSESELTEHYEKFESFEGLLPKKLCLIIKKQADNDTQNMVKCIKNWRIIISGTKGYAFSQITSGGVELGELTENNESKLSKGLYILGELTDNQFECGGYNLNYAIYSGINAGENIIRKYTNDKN